MTVALSPFPSFRAFGRKDWRFTQRRAERAFFFVCNSTTVPFVFGNNKKDFHLGPRFGKDSPFDDPYMIARRR